MTSNPEDTMTDDKSELAATLRGMSYLLAWELSLAEQLAGSIAALVPSCGVVPVDQRERLPLERYGKVRTTEPPTAAEVDQIAATPLGLPVFTPPPGGPSKWRSADPMTTADRGDTT